MRAATLHIPKPCAESWDQMTPTAAGRHCTACQKPVVDFTLMTDAEILALLMQAAGKSTCGRFRAGQLDRPLLSPEPASHWRRWLGAVLTAGSLSSLSLHKAAAQTTSASYSGGGPEPSIKPVTTVAPVPTAKAQPLQNQPALAPQPQLFAQVLLVRGVVLDASSHEPIPGATVLIKNTALGTSTNAAGEFELAIATASQGGRLQVSSVGYNRVEQNIPAPTSSDSTAIVLPPMVLQTDTTMLGGLEVMVSVKPYSWRPRALYYWGKYWLTRPFRRY